MSGKQPWSLQRSSSFPSSLVESSSSACTPFLLSSLMNAQPASADVFPFPISSSYDGCARISQKPLSPCRFPESTGKTQCASKTTSHIVLPPSKKRASADVRAFRRSSLCPTRRWHNAGSSRKSMYVICEEDEQTFAVPPTPPNTLNRRPPLKRIASDSSVPITSAVNSEEWSGRYVRFAHMVVEVRMPPVEDQTLEEEDLDSDSSSSQTDSICSESTGSEPDLDHILIEGKPEPQKKVRRPVSRLSKVLRGYY